MNKKPYNARDCGEFDFPTSKLGLVPGSSKQIQVSAEPGADYYEPFAHPERELDLSAELVKVARQELHRRQARARHLPDKFFGEGAWQILLYLFISQHRGGRASLLGTHRAAGISEGACIRWLKALQCDGLLLQSSPRTEQSVSQVSLTPKGYKSVRSTLLDFRELS